MLKKKKQPARSYNFKTYIEGNLVSFSKISGMKSHWHVEPFQEGGRNNTEYKSKVSGKESGQLTLSRLVTLVSLGKKKTFKAGQKLKKDVEVYLTNDKGKPKRGYSFIGCTVTEVNYSELDSGQSQVLLENIVIDYQRMEED